MQHTWVILGATSAMARAFARALSEQGHALILAGRDMDDLKTLAADCTLRGASDARALRFDAREAKHDAPILDALEQAEGTLNAAVFIGSMPEQARIDDNPLLLQGVMQDNFTGPARFLHAFAPMIEARGGGTIVGVGSVAGDRGRIGNYAYGASKSAFHTYLAGLRNRLGRAGGHVITVKPGFVDSAMTWGIKGMFLVAAPGIVARDILRAVNKRRNVIYTPGFWRLIMLIIRTIPEPIFKKLSI
ncbi:MAG: SDR family NAD(P)-dependent oxidoreductase [Sediminimonas qiaohouensis]|uniref:SDR family NAD(P)-dependent oxidoreductase n=1 Tax=Sediminimonas qiaohouensis TaxID=552061 RepID=A0A7C9LJK4_9RHOB|nr:SDR family NAD(P)-dependent oxidoreductase [Sediminimonas qiaohouensis]MTJ03259.1 SDR family NAD(P)-dependent oxidoreductase [Sediminimonas qiaohouensis]